MKSAIHVVHEEVGGLEDQQAELLRQLATVQQQIAAAKAKKVGFVALLISPSMANAVISHPHCLSLLCVDTLQ